MLEQGALATAVATHDGEKFAGMHLQADIFERFDAIGIAMPKSLDLNRGWLAVGRGRNRFRWCGEVWFQGAGETASGFDGEGQRLPAQRFPQRDQRGGQGHGLHDLAGVTQQGRSAITGPIEHANRRIAPPVPGDVRRGRW